MEFNLILLYSTFCFIGAILPGPTSFLALALGLQGNIRLVLLASIGAAIADFLIICAVGLGLNKLITDFPIVFEIIKYLGFCYLIFIAIMIWKSEPTIKEKNYEIESIYNLPIKGFLTAVSNPKVLVFFIAFLPQFINTKIDIMPQYLLLGLISSLIDIISMSVYGLLGVKLLHLFKSKRNMNILNKASAICMGIIAIFLIFR
ncbi:LysE family translocator [Acinetobacter sp. ACIN00229]|uniref:LysE family translocator n=1 Tax=Acinetobacter sp. ACIN00229 TaxID=2792607 RepID=UPI0018DFE2B1|nr:LysE family translocator [Acinetobacter sp. ACIN00229]MBI0422495.1 LysE family translocator [Acinetobacter sp. ACIN00229]